MNDDISFAVRYMKPVPFGSLAKSSLGSSMFMTHSLRSTIYLF